jgi:hypothetical protein
MKKYLVLVSALMIGCFTLASVAKVYALGEEPKAVVVTPEDAAKKYPMPKGQDYPAGINANKGSATASGFVQSPYSARIYDARKLGRGTLILDEGVNKVFKKP